MSSPTTMPFPSVLQPSFHQLTFSTQDSLTPSAQTLLPSQIPNPTSSPSGGLSEGTIVGVVSGVVGAIVVGAIVILIVIPLYKKKKGKCLPSCNYFV